MKLSNKILGCVCLLVVLAACSVLVEPQQSPFQGGHPQEPSEGGTLAAKTGKVILSVVGTGARTILPDTPLFAKYQFSFVPLNGQEGHDSVTVDASENEGFPVELAVGRWNIIARGLVHISGIDDIEDGDYRAAEYRPAKKASCNGI